MLTAVFLLALLSLAVAVSLGYQSESAEKSDQKTAERIGAKRESVDRGETKQDDGFIEFYFLNDAIRQELQHDHCHYDS